MDERRRPKRTAFPLNKKTATPTLGTPFSISSSLFAVATSSPPSLVSLVYKTRVDLKFNAQCTCFASKVQEPAFQCREHIGGPDFGYPMESTILNLITSIYLYLMCEPTKLDKCNSQ